VSEQEVKILAIRPHPIGRRPINIKQTNKIILDGDMCHKENTRLQWNRK
jgi:hypothetical protein